MIRKLHGLKINDSKIHEKFNLVIVGLINGDGSYQINPDPSTVLNESHTLMLIGEQEKLDLFKETFREK